MNRALGMSDKELQAQAAAGYWSQATGTVISCPECQRKMVAPSERTATIRCPKCLATWMLTTGEAAEPLREKDTLADRRLKEVNETVTERRLSSSETPEKRPTSEEQYQTYLEFGADFNWD